MLMTRAFALATVCVICTVLSVASAIAAECQQESFGNWLEHFKQEATGLGISQPTIASALNGITYDPAIIARDHSQSVFQQSFEQFSGRMVSPDRLRKGANMLKRYGSILNRIEDRYGVPGEVLVAIWGLESDYGVNQGKYSTIRSLAIRIAASFASSKSRPCSINSAPNARIAAFFSVELPCGTTIITAMPARAPANASD